MESSVEKELAEKQLSISGFNFKSWFSKIRCLLTQYNLPSAHKLIQNPVSRYQWKAKVKKAVKNVWHEQLRQKYLYTALFAIYLQIIFYGTIFIHVLQVLVSLHKILAAYNQN